MAKPIFLVKVNIETSPEMIKRTEALVESKIKNEYHVLVAACLLRGDPEFVCLNAETMPESTVEEIKEWIKNPIK